MFRENSAHMRLPINSNFSRYWHLKFENYLFSHPSLVWRRCWGERCRIYGWNLPRKILDGWGYRMVKIHNPIFNRFWLIYQCDRRRDRRTDLAYSALSIMLSRWKVIKLDKTAGKIQSALPWLANRQCSNLIVCHVPLTTTGLIIQCWLMSLFLPLSRHMHGLIEFPVGRHCVCLVQ